MIEVLTYKDPKELEILKRKSIAVDFEKDNFAVWASALKGAALASKCIGLAMPQIGLTRRIIAVKMPAREILIMINPVLVEKSGSIKFREGCLSLPGLNVNTKRYNKITVVYFTENGDAVRYSAEGMEAVCIQHEIDHLDGILMTDHGMPFKV